MNNLEKIETFFNNDISTEDRLEFEKRLLTDPEFASDIAFYVASGQAAGAAKQEKKDHFRHVYDRYKAEHTDTHESTGSAGIMKLWPWLSAAAAVLLLFFAWNAWLRPASPRNLAEKYIAEQLHNLPVMMSDNIDSMQAGLRLYNEGEFTRSLSVFEAVLMVDTGNYEAKKFAGIVSLRLEQYDKALLYFKQLANLADLYSNPGIFYQSITLMKRDLPGDKLSARQLLQQVVEQDLEGSEYARAWLKKW